MGRNYNKLITKISKQINANKVQKAGIKKAIKDELFKGNKLKTFKVTRKGKDHRIDFKWVSC